MAAQHRKKPNDADEEHEVEMPEEEHSEEHEPSMQTMPPHSDMPPSEHPPAEAPVLTTPGPGAPSHQTGLPTPQMDVLTEGGVQSVDPTQVPGYSAPVMPGNVIQESEDPGDVIHNRPNIRTPGPQYYPPELPEQEAPLTGPGVGAGTSAKPQPTEGHPLQAGEPVIIEPAEEDKT